MFCVQTFDSQFPYRFVSTQVFTGTAPFNNLVACEALSGIPKGIRPSRPTHPALTETLWDLMQRCWDHDPRLRPDAAEVSGVLRASSVFSFVLVIRPSVR